MKRKCAFCGTEGSSREHIWPRWIRKHAYDFGGYGDENTARYWATIERPGREAVTASTKVGNGRLSLVGRHVCKSCNEGWMSSLEVRVAPALRLMMEGRSAELDAGSVRTVRAWAVKTALNFGYAAQGLEINMPASAGRALYDLRRHEGVAPGTEVWVAAYDDARRTFAYRSMVSRAAGLHPKTRTVHNLLRVIFVAGSAVFYVRVPDSSDSRGMVNRKPLAQFTPLFEFREPNTLPWRRHGLSDAEIGVAMTTHLKAGIGKDEHLQQWVAPPGAEEVNQQSMALQTNVAAIVRQEARTNQRFSRDSTEGVHNNDFGLERS